ncbi:hypothetical protein ACFW34_35140 [Streptomyces sp. NPDC058848]|uniref:hypothetical protein n=1 Tax=Streptomyces sp. NPDC058848 TaxID=3346650 RepID=UPI0036A920D4
MTTTTYTGALQRSAHFAFRPPVPGVNPEHEKPAPDPDPFSPAPEGAGARPAQGGNVWQPQELPVHTDMVVGPRPHTTPLEPPVPSNVHRDQADRAATARMLANHSRVEYRPDRYAPYKHATQGVSIEWYAGRAPRDAGITVGQDAEFLVMGKNAFDQTNGVKPDVYAGDDANAGRYRLQANQQQFGLYEFSQKQGQDNFLRAYTGLRPAFPADKPRIEDSAPYTPNSSGTTTWTLSQWQVPSLFGLPSETSLTDHQVAAGDAMAAGGFDDGGRM